MNKILSLFIISVIALSSYIISAWAEEDFVLTVNNVLNVDTNHPIVVQGTTIDLDNNPVSNVQIAVVFPFENISTTTNSTGQFLVYSSKPTESGTYSATIYAKKDNKVASADIFYTVVNTKPIQDISSNSTKQIELDPFSKMIKEMEEQKTIQKKNDENTKQNYIIDEQRNQTKEDLQKDLNSLEKEYELHSPRNAFLNFLSDIDSAVRNIFWGQFLFTEDLTANAQIAKHDALDKGKTSLEATKIFQEEAAVSKKETVDYNKKLNINYGNATLNIQQQFDTHGKIPRK